MKRVSVLMSDQQLDMLARAAELAMPCLAVELGSYLGGSTTVLATAAKVAGCVIYAVDLWQRSDQVSPDIPYPYTDFSDGRSMLPEFCANLGELLRFVRPVCERVDLAARLFEDRSIGFLFHDASHDAESVARDLSVWLPKMEDGAWWVHHDLDWSGGASVFMCDQLHPELGQTHEMGVFRVRRSP